MVQINVAQQLKSAIGLVRNYEIDEEINIDGSQETIQGIITLTRTDRGILVKTELKKDVELNCGRCLNDYSQIVPVNLDEEYFPVTDVNTGSVISVPDEQGSFIIDENNILDLTEAIRQYILMAIPIKPLCRQDCAGLCPTCGADLNMGKCECPSVPVDIRWDALKKLAVANNDIIEND
ncbi:DUF177 domain-containing protein [Chloroflexota bacterium]